MSKLKAFFEITKPKQTLLLMLTFVFSYILADGRLGGIFLVTFLATFLAVSGTTAINMWLDKDIDSLMPRTKNRPLPAKKIEEKDAAIFGTLLFIASSAIAIKIDLELFLVILAGLIFDIFFYTLMLKRKSPYSILVGGIAGMMPALAGWVSAAELSYAGILVAAIVLIWIPSHIWYIAIHYEEDYRIAKVPMFPVVFGVEKTAWAIVVANTLMIPVLVLIYLFLKLNLIFVALAISVVLVFLYKAVKFAVAPSREGAKIMYKSASMMLSAIYISLLFGKLI